MSVCVSFQVTLPSSALPFWSLGGRGRANSCLCRGSHAGWALPAWTAPRVPSRAAALQLRAVCPMALADFLPQSCEREASQCQAKARLSSSVPLPERKSETASPPGLRLGVSVLPRLRGARTSFTGTRTRLVFPHSCPAAASCRVPGTLTGQHPAPAQPAPGPSAGAWPSMGGCSQQGGRASIWLPDAGLAPNRLLCPAGLRTPGHCLHWGWRAGHWSSPGAGQRV